MKKIKFNDLGRCLICLKNPCQCKVKKNKEAENIMLKLSREIAENRAKIIDDFLKTYIASRWQDYFSKKKKIDFRRIELVERRDSPIEITYFIRLRRGKLPIENRQI